VSRKLESALAYAKRGWPVFPCGVNKQPLVANGFHAASCDEARVRDWWEAWPDAQIGIACGAAGIAVVDLDVGKGKDGVKTWHALVDDHGRHGCGLVASTPRSGRHMVYAMPAPAIGCRTDVLPGSGIDVRAEGGYILAPDLEGAGGREWIEGDPFDPSDLCPMPPWVRSLLCSSRAAPGGAAAGAAAGAGAAARGGEDGDVVPLIPEMRRLVVDALDHIDPDPRDTWIRVGMALRNTGAGDEAYQLWCEWSSASPKYDEKVQRRQWESLRQWRHDGSEVAIRTLFWMAEQAGWTPSLDEAVAAELAGEPDSFPEHHPVTAGDGSAAERAGSAAPPCASTPQPFPMQLLNDCPGLLGDVARWGLENSVKRQPALMLGSTIATLGAVVGRRVATATNLRTNFVMLGIGETACGKDATLKLPQELLIAAGLPRLVGPSEWASAPGMRAWLAKEPAHVCFIDEFAKLLQQTSGPNVPAHLAGIRRNLLDLFGRAGGVWAPTAYADHKLHDHSPISEPHLCVYGTGVPAEVFAAMGRASAADGFLNRLLICWADEQLPTRNRIGRATPPAGLVQRLQALDAATRPSGNLAGKASGYGVDTGCRTIPWGTGAEEAWEAIRDDFEQRMVAARKEGSEWADLWARSGEHVAKLALLRSVCDDPRRAICHQDVDWATQFVLWTTERTMLAAADRIAENDYERGLKAVHRAIRAAGPQGLTSGEMLRKFAWLRSRELKDVLASLELQGEIDRLTTKHEGPGRPRVAYVALLIASE
jgi:hypothetical protein